MLPSLSSKLSSTLARATALLALTAATCLSAQVTHNVGPGQTYTTIQSGINAANNGDTVLVAPGTYYENIDFKGKAILVTSSGGAANTIIDGGGTTGTATVSFQSGELRSSVISNFTIRNGGNSSIGGSEAGGVYVAGAAPTISNNTITANDCYGVYVGFGAALIESNEINSTAAGGPGSYCIESGAAVVLGGNATVGGLSHSSVIGNTIENNNAGSYAGAVVIYAAEGSLLQNNIIRNNYGQAGGALWAVNTDNMSILQNLIYGNSASGEGLSNAGGLSILPPDESVGPFIGVIAGNTITQNSITEVEPGESATEVAIEGNLGQYVMVNNIVVGSSSVNPALVCGEIYNYLSTTPLVFDHNDIYNSNGAAYGGACTVLTGSYGNISVDPRFASPSAYNFQLSAGSPAIDTGNNSAPLLTSTDIAGVPRIQDATNLGYPVIDMGAYEFSGIKDKSPTILTLTPSEYEVTTYSAPLTFTVTLTSAAGTPSGPVTIYDNHNSLATVLVDSSGTYVYTPPTLTAGLNAFVATYPGSGGFPPAASVMFYLLIPQLTTTLTLTSSPNPSFLGQPVTFTVNSSSVDGYIPTPVTLTDATSSTLLATLTPNTSGVATYTTSTLTLGNHQIRATYAGAASYVPATASLTQQVVSGAPTTTTLTSSLNPSTYGQPVTFTATVTAAAGTPTGSILFTDGGTQLGTVNLNANGVAQFTTSALTANDLGTTLYHQINVTYVPTGNFGDSSASLDQVVNGLPSNTILVVTPTSGTTSTAFTLTATVSSGTPASATVPTGTVVFYSIDQPGVQGSEIGYAVLVNGVATLTSNHLLTSSNYIVGIYFGDTIYASSTSNYFAVTITGAPPSISLTSSLNPAPALTPITFTAQLPANSGGAVVFNVNGQNITTTPNAAGIATTTISTLPQGTYLITATWNATGHALGAQASLTQVVTAALAAPDFSLAGTNISFKVLHSGTGDLELASLNNFSGNVALTCNPPYPANYTCTLQYPSVSLTPGRRPSSPSPSTTAPQLACAPRATSPSPRSSR